jgi:1-acyl-sn-glycerol-3-phosphate acyltransferase
MFKMICAFIFKFMGYKLRMDACKDIKSSVIVGAPHTTNWDFFAAMFLIYFSKLNARFVIKKEFMKFPLNLIFKPMGAIAVDREKIARGEAESTTDLMADLYKEHEDLYLMVAPEGTRSYRDEWKSGFYYIAVKAKVPITLAFVDYENKVIGVDKVIYPSDYEKDMKEIMSFYATIKPKISKNFSLDKRFIEDEKE